jgi:serine/threonine protein kinase
LGQLLGNRYKIIRQLGEGGQAHAYLVNDTKGEHGHVVAKRLKNINRHGRFVAEVEALSRINHPGIIRILDHALDDKKPFLVTEYCEAGSLEHLHGIHSDIRAMLETFLAICEAVGVAHSQGITHRDLKPDNVLLRTKDGPPVVCDFGLCFILDGERLTLTDEAAGSRYFMAPELEDGRAADIGPASDVYSLGKLLYWMLAGRIFAREQHRESAWNLPEKSQDRDHARVYVHLLDLMITKAPDRRLADANQVASAVRRVLRLMMAGNNVISNKVPQRCTYCGIGLYSLVANDAQGGTRFGVAGVGSPSWNIRQCDHCGHVEMFRLDDPEVHERWKR